jgi:ABC-type hemin transport system substrate-binding protein
MKNSLSSIVIFFCFIFLPTETVLAVQPAQLLRSEELNAQQQQLLDQLHTSRVYSINDYSFSGITLTAEQSQALKQIVEPALGNFLNKEEIDKLCASVREYIRKEVKPSARITCKISKDIFKLEASE